MGRMSLKAEVLDVTAGATLSSSAPSPRGACHDSDPASLSDLICGQCMTGGSRTECFCGLLQRQAIDLMNSHV